MIVETFNQILNRTGSEFFFTDMPQIRTFHKNMFVS